MQQEARPSEPLGKFKSTVFKTAQCTLKAEHKDRERESPCNDEGSER